MTSVQLYASDLMRFLRAWIAHPRGIAAVAPSSASLSRLITQEIAPSDGPVLELGAGTGVFTKALLARGIAEANLTIVEHEPEFANLLQARFPEARVIQVDAARISKHDLFAVADVGTVVSGLPLLSMSPRKVLAILSDAFSYMRPTGSFYQFTYLPRCPVSRLVLDRLGLKATRVGTTLWNLPPAAVYRFSRRQPFGSPRRSHAPDTHITCVLEPLELDRELI